jgi:hypothetical protein
MKHNSILDIIKNRYTKIIHSDTTHPHTTSLYLTSLHHPPPHPLLTTYNDTHSMPDVSHYHNSNDHTIHSHMKIHTQPQNNIIKYENKWKTRNTGKPTLN